MFIKASIHDFALVGVLTMTATSISAKLGIIDRGLANAAPVMTASTISLP
jgi:hypothetical protein